jgi:3',5'-cyclic AMP phosphodiesterase CpdA
MFTLAHLSDPHLAPLPKPRSFELAGKRALGFINWQRNRRFLHRRAIVDALVQDLKASAPDHIAVTGDLVNLSLEAEFAPARAWLHQFGTPLDVTVVPGNHDAYMRVAAAHPATYWGSYMRGDDAETTAFPFLRRRGPAALIGVSTAVPTGPFLATGYLGGEQLARLSDLLAQSEQQSLFRVVLIHHPPVSAPGKRFKRLLDAEAFRRVIAQRGAELVLHGHDHVHATTWLDGPRGRVPAVGVPSASTPVCFGHEAAAYNLYRIDGSAGAWRCEVTSRGFSQGMDIGELRRWTLSGAASTSRQ